MKLIPRYLNRPKITFLKGSGNGWQPYKWQASKQQQAAQDYARQVVQRVHEISEDLDKSRANLNKTSNKYKIPRDNSDIVNLQKDLFNKGYYGNISYSKAIDGIWGNMTENAYRKATNDGYVREHGKLVIPEDNRTLGDYYNEAKNLLSGPAIPTLVNDVVRNTINKIAGKTVLPGNTVTSLNPGEEDAIRELIRNSQDGIVNGDSYRKVQNVYAGGKRDILNRLGTNTGQIEHTLGQFSNYVDPETGDTIVTDTYDFNKNQRSSNQGWYSKVRDLAGKLASQDDSPDAQKTHFKINISKNRRERNSLNKIFN